MRKTTTSTSLGLGRMEGLKGLNGGVYIVIGKEGMKGLEGLEGLEGMEAALGPDRAGRCREVVSL